MTCFKVLRSGNLYRTERESVKTGIMSAEDAITNAIGEKANYFFKDIGNIISLLPKNVMEVSIEDIEEINENNEYIPSNKKKTEKIYRKKKKLEKKHRDKRKKANLDDLLKKSGQWEEAGMFKEDHEQEEAAFPTFDGCMQKIPVAFPVNEYSNKKNGQGK